MRALSLALLILASQSASACGYCVEDKVAATYDHAVVTRAMAQKHHVAFFHVDGAPVAQEATRRALERSVYAVAGVDKGSARISPDALTLSFSFDPGRVSLVKVNALLDRSLSGRGLSLMPFLVMEKPADLKAVKR